MNKNKDTLSHKGLLRRIKQHLIAKPHKLFASVRPGFEELLHLELQEILPATDFHLVEGGIEFIGSLDDLHAVNMYSQCASRFLLRLGRFYADTFSLFKKEIANIEWELLLSSSATLSFDITCSKSKLMHTGRLEEEARSAINERLNSVPSLDSGSKNQCIFIKFIKDICYLNLDSSGDPLYKRNIKTHVNDGPLRETDAALILRKANLLSYDILVDPMSGSGTFSIEATLMKENKAANQGHDFPFYEWPSFKEARFNALMQTLSKKRQTHALQIYTSDKSQSCIEIISKNINNLECKSLPSVNQGDFFSLSENTLPTGKRLLVLNPPYGKRIAVENTFTLYQKIFKHIREAFSTTDYAVIVPQQIYKKLHLSEKHIETMRLRHGGLETFIVIKKRSS